MSQSPSIPDVAVLETPKTVKPQKSRVISTVLSPALRLWLRSQVEQVEALHFKIGGGDRQILGGYIPSVYVAASGAVYQGLHLSQIELEGSDIRVNLGQVLKGKPLRLLDPVPVVGQLLLLESDLQASLESPLLSSALTELLDTLLKSNGITNPANDLKDQPINWQHISIGDGQLTLSGTLTDSALQTTPVEICAGLQLATPHKLRLDLLHIQLHSDTLPLNVDDVQIDLGSDVDIQELTLTSGQLICHGRLKVIP